MSGDLLLDTHIALWLDSGDRRLRRSTRELIDGAWRDGGRALISAVSAWEIAMLAFLGRITLDVSVREWIERFADHPGVETIPLSVTAACGAFGLDGPEYRDPADRLLIAAAIELGCPLVTYDARIVGFAEQYGERQGFSVVG